jgi:hypothetical protein
MPDYLFVNVNTVEDEPSQTPRILLVQTDNPASIQPDVSELLDIIQSKTASVLLVDENYINQRRLLRLKSQFTPKLLNLILESDFEYGIESEVDVFVRNQMKENSLATKSWLNDIFVENISNPVILVGILRIMSRLSYYEVLPQGQVMAIAALSHNDVEVKECGVRAFENWGSLDSIRILESLHVSPSWLQEYIDQVIKDLREKHNVAIS